MIDQVNICSIRIDNLTMRNALKKIDYLILRKTPSYVVTPNVDHIINLGKDLEFQEIYQEADMVLADGMPLLWAAKFLGTPLREKISGSDIFPELCKIAAGKGYKLFFMGGRPGAASKTSEVLKIKYPNMQIVGIYSPPFGFENNKAENNKIIKMIRDSKPDILFVGLGAPKQEKWIYRYKNEYLVPVSIGIGASFDFAAGIIRRAPLWMQKVGLEWFWRLLMEPRRLWRRYLIDDMQFFWLVVKQKICQTKNEKN